MNTFMMNLNQTNSMTRTTNGALAHSTTGSKVYDMFALGAAYRNRTDKDVITLFREAFKENPEYALKCLFYIRDVRGGQGERRFFKVAMRDLVAFDKKAVLRNMKYIPEFGRWDDLYVFVGTAVEKEMFALMREQLKKDLSNSINGNVTQISLLAKWLKSENASGEETKRLAKITRKTLGFKNAKEYRKTLTTLRQDINVLEMLMSAQRWEDIEFDKIPSKAGLKYKKAFARHDLERVKADIPVQTYAEFARDTTKKVNASALYPYEIVEKAFGRETRGWAPTFCYADETDRLMINKYWENQKDYFNGNGSNILCVVDTSGSMFTDTKPTPLSVAIGLGMYAAERSRGAFKDCFITFSGHPELVKIQGADFCEKVQNISRANWGMHTNLVATFSMLKKVAKRSKPEDIPESIVIISDMQINGAIGCYGGNAKSQCETEMERIHNEWAAEGLKCPKLVYWNVNASKDTILDGSANVSYVSGCSPSLFEQVLTGKTGYDLMMETLNQKRYSVIA